MEASEWIALAGLVLVVALPLVGTLWVSLGGRVDEAHKHAEQAHKRMDDHSAIHARLREEVTMQFGTLRERLASDYVKSEHLRERLAEVLAPLRDALATNSEQMAATNRKLDRIERSQVKLMERMHIPAVGPEDQD